MTVSRTLVKRQERTDGAMGKHGKGRRQCRAVGYMTRGEREVTRGALADE